MANTESITRSAKDAGYVFDPSDHTHMDCALMEYLKRGVGQAAADDLVDAFYRLEGELFTLADDSTVSVVTYDDKPLLWRRVIRKA